MPAPANQTANTVQAVLFFVMSTAITWWFISENGVMYESSGHMYLSCGIAGAKWAIQLVAAYFFLPVNQKWLYIRRLGMVCLIGSLILLPFCFGIVKILLGTEGFYGSLIASVLVMIPLYYRAVRKTGLPVKWFWGWIGCLALAITLQLLFAFYATSVV